MDEERKTWLDQLAVGDLVSVSPIDGVGRQMKARVSSTCDRLILVNVFDNPGVEWCFFLRDGVECDFGCYLLQPVKQPAT